MLGAARNSTPLFDHVVWAMCRRAPRITVEERTRPTASASGGRPAEGPGAGSFIGPAHERSHFSAAFRTFSYHFTLPVAVPLATSPGLPERVRSATTRPAAPIPPASIVNRSQFVPDASTQ